jgi:SAM-dependent methyltransferase
MDLYFQIHWHSDDGVHTDSYSAQQVSLWRDILPRPLMEKLLGRHSGDLVRLRLPAEMLFDTKARSGLVEIKRSQFDAGPIFTPPPRPRLGRYYPKGVLKDMAGIFRANRMPFRVVGLTNGKLSIDMRHPMAGRRVDLSVTIGATGAKPHERGGALHHWGDIITEGVGMQARWQNQPTCFFDDRPFERADESPDPLFYRRPRLVQHLDDMAVDMVRQIYARFLTDGMRVLDLMSSWQSHLPEDIELKHLSGLGLNPTELEKNPRLNQRVVHDVNRQPYLPYADAHFDRVICTVSVEYLIHPFEVFAEVARVLRPGGIFAVVFSNRWFAPKAIRIWSELHEFERMGLVLEYFRRGGLFSDLHTYSVRGLARPLDDKYIERTPYSDPIYAVWGRRNR